MNELLEAALEYADRGWPIFPCKKDKTPHTINGVLDATTNPKQIKKWWKKHPKANIAVDCGGAGLLVLDYDPGSDYKATRKALGKPPRTDLRQTTPRGGKHEIYELDNGEIVSNSASKISPNVDVRSFNGYVLLPPSRTKDGEYAWVSEGEPQFRTDEMVRVANSHRERSEDANTWIIEPDLDENIDSAIDWLENDAKIAVEGEGGDHMAYATAAMMKSFGLTEETAFDLMWEHWNPRCDPPWGEDELDHFLAKVEHGHDYNTSQPGNMTPAYKEAKRQERKEMFEPVIRAEEVKGGKAITITDGHHFRITNRWGMKQIKKPEWVIEGLIQEETHCLMFGAPGTFKSFLALDIALSVCQGFAFEHKRVFGDVMVMGSVLYLAGEGRGSLNQRVEAWEREYNDGEPMEAFHLGDPVPGVASTDEEFDRILETIRAAIPKDGSLKLIILDTLSRAMQGLDENSQQWASKYIWMVDILIKEFGCSVLSIGHTPKNDPESYRGSAAFHGGVDTMINVVRPTEAFNIEIKMQKQKDAPEWDKPLYAAAEEHAFTDGTTSLYVRPLDSRPEEKPKDDKKGRSLKKEPTPEKKQMLRETIIKRVKEALQEVKGGHFSHNKMSVKVAQGVDLGSGAIRKNHLVHLAENDLKEYYDANKSYWIWKK